jgi:hypothetical protein
LPRQVRTTENDARVMYSQTLLSGRSLSMGIHYLAPSRTASNSLCCHFTTTARISRPASLADDISSPISHRPVSASSRLRSKDTSDRTNASRAHHYQSECHCSHRRNHTCSASPQHTYKTPRKLVASTHNAPNPATPRRATQPSPRSCTSSNTVQTLLSLRSHFTSRRISCYLQPIAYFCMSVRFC